MDKAHKSAENYLVREKQTCTHWRNHKACDNNDVAKSIQIKAAHENEDSLCLSCHEG